MVDLVSCYHYIYCILFLCGRLWQFFLQRNPAGCRCLKLCWRPGHFIRNDVADLSHVLAVTWFDGVCTFFQVDVQAKSLAGDFKNWWPGYTVPEKIFYHYDSIIWVDDLWKSFKSFTEMVKGDDDGGWFQKLSFIKPIAEFFYHVKISQTGL